MRVQYLGPVILGVIVAVFVAVTFSSTSNTSALPSYLATFNTKYGTGSTKLNSCETCHLDPEGGGDRNPYGEAFAGQGGSTDARLAAIESMDSDGDTFSNIDEINAGTWPGDANDFPGGGPTPTPPPPTPTPVPVNLTSKPVDAAPVLDGSNTDAVWSGATAVNIPVAGGANMGSTNVSVKSVYTADSVYFLLEYNDPTESLQRFPWQRQADGTWEKLESAGAATHEETQYYEDKVALAWDIDVTGFASGGCAVACHIEQPANSGYGNMYTQNPGEELDIWHWKSVRTNPVDQVDDQYINSDRYDAATAVEAGRHSDPKISGGYSDNKNADNTAPGFTSPDQPAPPYWIPDSEKQVFPVPDGYQTGDEIAGIIVSPFVADPGGRADVQGKGAYSGGHWTLEIGRPLVTGGEHDIQYDDLEDTYPFAVAVFDNAQVNHAYQNGAALLAFAPAGPALMQGDVDCDGAANSVDALKLLRFVANLSVAQGPDCPLIGSQVGSLFGDVDCSNAVNSVDALKTLRFVANLSVAQTEPCADIGDQLD